VRTSDRNDKADKYSKLRAFKDRIHGEKRYHLKELTNLKNNLRRPVHTTSLGLAIPPLLLIIPYSLLKVI
jgi:hypothetical protein